MAGMAAKADRNPLSHFGRQVRKERLARGWSLDEMARRTGLAAPYWSQIENGKRPPTERVAIACDEVFPERRNYFSEYYEESRSWVPASFRSWAEYEDRATSLRVWSPGVLHGLVQTEAYARGLLVTAYGATDEVVASRLRSRMERQRRVLMREDPPAVWFVVDELSLYREVGSPDVMAAQLEHLLNVATMPHVVVQVLPAVANPATQSSFIVTDDAAYAEHVIAGFTYMEQETVTSALRTFTTILSESYRASESVALIKEVGETWATGVSPLTAGRTAETA
jgi:transcriptional regulator with XRE-family HTH domain